MIYYVIETEVGLGKKDILVITESYHLSSIVNALSSSLQIDANFPFATQTALEGIAQALTIGELFIRNEGVCFITADCIILGEERAEKIHEVICVSELRDQSTIFVSNDFICSLPC